MTFTDAKQHQAALNETIADLCLNKPLYTSVADPKTDEVRPLKEFLAEHTVRFDCYCIYCKMVTPFKSTPSVSTRRSVSTGGRSLEHSPRYFGVGFLCLTVQCQRETTHSYSYLFSWSGEKITKIGQYPTYEDIASADFDRYRSILDRQDFVELRKAGGLFSHDVSIGAFVYLRRIFERLIEKHYNDWRQTDGPIEGWTAKRMDDRIGAIATALPSTLVENKQIYSILSKGIHALQEDECRKYFPVIRAGILAILDQDLQRRAKQKASDDLRKAISEIASEIGQEYSINDQDAEGKNAH